MRAGLAFIAFVTGIMVALPGVGELRTPRVGDPKRLADLRSAEALHTSRGEDTLVALGRLRELGDKSRGTEMGPRQTAALAQLALEYGLFEEARSLLVSISSRATATNEVNRYWYALARAYFDRGRPEDALEALGRMRDIKESDLDGERRLLTGQVLLALGRDVEAAEVLENWSGSTVQVAYASYNRGIALLRSGRTEEGIRSLAKVSSGRGEGAELLALQDRANLALGHALAEQRDFDLAKRYLEDVRTDGPFSNSALLALGWIEFERQQPTSALESWHALRERSRSDPSILSDPSIQESLLTVPTVKRDLNQFDRAARDYEVAVVAYNRELDRLANASGLLESDRGLEALLASERGLSDEVAGRDVTAQHRVETPTRYLGGVLAGGGYRVALQDYTELMSLEDALAKSMNDVDALGGVQTGRVPISSVTPSLPGPPSPRPRTEDAEGARSASAGSASGLSRSDARPELIANSNISAASQKPGEERKRTRKGLGELELPPERSVAPFPELGVERLPAVPDDYWLPQADGKGLPPEPEYLDTTSGTVVSLPDEPQWQEPDESYRWLPYPPFDPKRPVEVAALGRGPPPPVSAYPFPADGAPVDGGAAGGGRLGDLDAAIGGVARHSERLVAAMDEMAYPDSDFGSRLEALRRRIAALRPRVAEVTRLHEAYLRQAALAELDRRKRRLENYLEHAQYDLARTYDLATQD